MLSLKITGPHSVRWLAETGQWALAPNVDKLPKEIPVSRFPFVIGRAEDCSLVLPQSEELQGTTSRWHCYLLERQEGQIYLGDGSLKAMPESGRPKPSISGTLLNGVRLQVPALLKAGDVLKVGPWQFEIKTAAGAKVEAGNILEDIAQARGRQVDPSDPRITQKFGQMHELVRRLAQIPGIEESLITLLSYCTAKIDAAEVAAILMIRPDGSFYSHLAWQKGMGKVPQFDFSQRLLQSLPPQQSFLLQSKLKDRSQSQSVHDISSGLLLPLWGKGDRLGVFYLDNRHSGKTFTDEDLYLASAIASLVSLQLALGRQAELTRIEENMSRYFAPDVVQRILAQSAAGTPVGLEVQEKFVAVLFVDMEGFTSMSRTKTPKEISEILNPYFETLAQCIQNNGGHVNKFIGDAVMGIFGANPGETGDLRPQQIAAQAARAALDMLRRWPEVMAQRGLPQKRLRVGINAGRAVVGNIGYSQRLEYSVLGDAVNVASRMEHLAPPNRAAVSEETRKLLDGNFTFDDGGEQEVKGVGKVHVYIIAAPVPASAPSPQGPA